MRLGIFGGSFDPPHAGHLRAAEAFVGEMKLDRLLVIPAGIPPHKRMEKLCSDADRLEMARLCFLSVPGAEVSDMEIKREGKSYTVDTLTELRRLYPHDGLFLYCGSDMLLSFTSWKDYEKILSLCTLCAMKRDGAQGFGERIDALSAVRLPVRTLRAPYITESSTQIREQLARGETPSGLTEEVARYVRERGLYGK